MTRTPTPRDEATAVLDDPALTPGDDERFVGSRRADARRRTRRRSCKRSTIRTPSYGARTSARWARSRR